VWKAKTLLAFLESQESQGFPGKPRDSRLSWLFLMCKKARKARNFSGEFRGILGSFLQGYLPTQVKLLAAIVVPSGHPQ